ncbi:MAG: DivIVA domain-containing protein [Acidimicrobiaceae bacterium]|nr:DivIVA domain-containing protein [Acidimicrobiaceae bacterium]
MELTSKALREAEFREKRGGYHPEDVDRLLEEAAIGVDELHERLRQAVERAQKAEAAAADSSGDDESLRRTLVLAQRTADMAIQDAREQATQIVAAAEQQAQALLNDAEERARRAHEDAISEIRSELISLEAVRQRGQEEVDILNNWVQEHRSHLAATLKDALGVVERAGTLSPAPNSHPIEVGSLPPAERASSGPAANHPVDGPPPVDAPVGARVAGSAGAGSATDPTVAWSAPDLARTPEDNAVQFGGPLHSETQADSDAGANPQENGAVHETNAPAHEPQPPADIGVPAQTPDEQAIADFFDGDQLDDGEEPRFGGRLRRRH